jgi:hypothetical protein
MSISSMAEDSALRLGPQAVVPSTATVAAAAAATAAAAAASGATREEAISQGEQAATTVQADGQAAATPPSPLSQLVKYIPTETIALYIAVQGALGEVSAPAGKPLSDADFTSRWIWVGVMFVVTLALTIGLSFRSQKTATGDPTFQFPAFEVMAAGLAFAVWALSLPGTPLSDFEGYEFSAWNSVIILAGTIAISTSAYIFGKTVAWQKIVDV